MAPLKTEPEDATTMHLLNGARLVDGNGGGCQAMKARAEGDCFFVSVGSLAFGGHCTSVGQAKAHALSLQAAMVDNAIAKFEIFVEKKGCYGKTTFYDADVANTVFEEWSADGDYLTTEQVRVAQLSMIWSLCKVGTPCPIACAPFLPTFWTWASRCTTRVSAQDAVATSDRSGLSTHLGDRPGGPDPGGRQVGGHRRSGKMFPPYS